MPELKFAELIDGIVFMGSPLSRSRGISYADLGFWLKIYSESTPGCEVLGETTTVLGSRNVPQPDISMRILPECGGQSHNAANYLGGPPELIVEVSDSSSSRDLGIKLELYFRAGVREYINILLAHSRVIWRYLTEDRYEEMAPREDGLLCSRVFPGLWLDPGAVWNSEISIRAAVEQGLRSPEHAAFVALLASRRSD